MRLDLVIAGDVATYAKGTPAYTNLKVALSRELQCQPPACILSLLVSASSVAIGVLLAIPDNGATATTTGASVQAAAQNFVAQSTSTLGTSLGLAVVSVAPTVSTRTGVTVPLIVAPPPPSTPLSLPSLALSAGDGSNGILGLAVGAGAGGGALLVIVLVLCVWATRQQASKVAAKASAGDPFPSRGTRVESSASGPGRTKHTGTPTESGISDAGTIVLHKLMPVASGQFVPSTFVSKRSQPPPAPPAKERSTEMSSTVGGSMHVVNLVRWQDLTLKESIGAGSFGEVRVAVYNSTRCAIKSLRASTAPGALEALLQEFELTMRLHHPNVLLTMGIAHSSDDGKTGILMELMPASLLDVLHHHRKREQLATWEASLVFIALDVAKGMAYLHAKDVVHRDLKPGNVLLSKTWDAKVADFGTALTKYQYAGEAEGPVGTPPYMAPEAIALTSGAKAKPTDVWSFGCLLAHMGTRSIPFSHVQLPAGTPPKDALRALMAIIVEGHVTPLDQLRKARGCPPGILALACECVRMDPAVRPAFHSIVDELERIQGNVRASCPSTQLRRADLQHPDAGLAGASATHAITTYLAPAHATYVPNSPNALSLTGPALARLEVGATYGGPALARLEVGATYGATLVKTFDATLVAEPAPVGQHLSGGQDSPSLSRMIFGTLFSPKPDGQDRAIARV